MGRPLRFIPENRDGALVEVSCRTIEALPLLRPSRRFNEIAAGVIGRALEISAPEGRPSLRGRPPGPMGMGQEVELQARLPGALEICGLSFLSSHYHMLLAVDDQQSLTRFMEHFQSNLSREAGRLAGWRSKVWSRRYDSIVVSDEPEAQWARLKYVLANGTKEGLVASPYDWPGLHAARALVDGGHLEGYWFNRTKEWAARRRGEDFGTYDYATRYLVGFEPLPCFRHLPPEEYREKVAELVREIEEEAEQARGGRAVLGVEAILDQNPLRRPDKKPKRSPRPQFHAASKQARIDLRNEYSRFLLTYLEASAALRAGDLNAVRRFPAGSYPPAFPYIGAPRPPRPPSPPTRSLVVTESGAVERGEIPVVILPGRQWSTEPRARGQPP